MIKFMTGILGLALLATPLFGYAQGAKAPQPKAVKRAPALKADYPSYCAQQVDGSEYSGVVVGVGSNWYGDKTISFTVAGVDGQMYTEQAPWLIDQSQGALINGMANASYLNIYPLTIYCAHGKAQSVWLGNT